MIRSIICGQPCCVLLIWATLLSSNSKENYTLDSGANFVATVSSVIMLPLHKLRSIKKKVIAGWCEGT